MFNKVDIANYKLGIAQNIKKTLFYGEDPNGNILALKKMKFQTQSDADN